jgi:hypothetical protein
MLPYVTSARRMPLVLLGITVAGALAGGLTSCGSAPSAQANTCTVKSTASNGSTTFEQYHVSCATVQASDPVRFDDPVNQVVSGPPKGEIPLCHARLSKLGTVDVYQGNGGSASDICITAALVLG